MSGKLYWEDFKVGDEAVYGPRLVTREEIISFATAFDPQPMHLDEAAAAQTLLGGLGGSGWHACSVLRRIIADGFILNSSSMGSPGCEEVRWIKPLRPGLNLRVRTTVLETRPSNSKPGVGFVRMRFVMVDDNEAEITRMITTMMMGRRHAGVAA